MDDLSAPKPENSSVKSDLIGESQNVKDNSTVESSNLYQKVLLRHQQILKEESGLSLDILTRAGSWSASEEEADKIIGYPRSGVVFPYIDLGAKPIGYRIKVDDANDGAKYLERSLTDSHLSCYFVLENIAAILDPTKTLIITEGEKKLLALMQALPGGLYAFAAFPGCRNWMAKNEGQMTPEWESIQLKGRQVWLIPDTDFFENRKVYEPICNLIRILCLRGAVVSLVDLRLEGER